MAKSQSENINKQIMQILSLFVILLDFCLSLSNSFLISVDRTLIAGRQLKVELGIRMLISPLQTGMRYSSFAASGLYIFNIDYKKNQRSKTFPFFFFCYQKIRTPKSHIYTHGALVLPSETSIHSLCLAFQQQYLHCINKNMV